LYLIVLVTLFGTYSLFGITLYIKEWITIFQSLLLYKGNGIFWTIPVEFKFYFLLPFIALILRDLDLTKKAVYIWLFTFIIFLSMLTPRTYSTDFLPFSYIFILGSYTALFHKQFGLRKRNEFVAKIFDIVTISILILFILLIPNFFNMTFGTYYKYTHFHKNFLLFGVLSSVLIFSVMNGFILSRVIMESNILCYIGKISYGAYLWHMLVLQVVLKVSPFKWPTLNLALFISLTVLISHLSYIIIERPILKSNMLEKKWENLTCRWT
jgi:peptidoglycan/LPS O-acetylase OafA/YrhL